LEEVPGLESVRPADMTASYRFGDFEMRPARRELLSGGRPVALGGRAFDLLAALIAERDRVVGKNELMDLVWPKLVVEENNLAVQISTLRRVLGPAVIATIPGHGYRFAVAITGEGPQLSTSPATASRAETTPRATNLPVETEPLIGRDPDIGARRKKPGRCCNRTVPPMNCWIRWCSSLHARGPAIRQHAFWASLRRIAPETRSRVSPTRHA
jgi:DNA-binding winged helix-turn-helix (wHTH) protein